MIGSGSLVGRHFRDPKFRDLVLGLELLECGNGGLEGVDVGSLAVVVEGENVDVATFLGDARVQESGHVVHTHRGIIHVVGRCRRDQLGAGVLGFHVLEPIADASAHVHLRSAFVGGHVGLIEAHKVGVTSRVSIPDAGVRIDGAQQHGDELNVQSPGC